MSDLDDVVAALADLRRACTSTTARLDDVVAACRRLREAVRRMRDGAEVELGISRAERRAAREALRGQMGDERP